uniref:Uncharacterized protein LOC114329762 n=1 Tax=Diabrotica virgifera virgifera TaxID=50390 RepID=A0A6P7FG06_DIAVI
MIFKTRKTKWIPPENNNLYEDVLTRRIQDLENGIEYIEQANNVITKALKETESECCPTVVTHKEKLSQNTKELISKRRQLTEKYDSNYTTLKKLNKDIHRSIRKDIRENNTREITHIMQENKGLKVLRRNTNNIGNKNMYKIRNKDGNIATDKAEIL